MSKLIKNSINIILILLVIVIGYNAYFSSFIQKKYFYVFPYQSNIIQTAKQYKINPYLFVAVIKNESKFKADAISENGAIGLMQIMPETGKWILQQTKGWEFSPSILTEPTTNIRFGGWYLSELHSEFYGNEILVLAAYNAGRGNVQSWIKKYGWKSDFQDINSIPFKETQIYIRRIMHDKQMYAKYYEDLVIK